MIETNLQLLFVDSAESSAMIDGDHPPHPLRRTDATSIRIAIAVALILSCGYFVTTTTAATVLLPSPAAMRMDETASALLPSLERAYSSDALTSSVLPFISSLASHQNCSSVELASIRSRKAILANVDDRDDELLLQDDGLHFDVNSDTISSITFHRIERARNNDILSTQASSSSSLSTFEAPFVSSSSSEYTDYFRIVYSSKVALHCLPQNDDRFEVVSQVESICIINAGGKCVHSKGGGGGEHHQHNFLSSNVNFSMRMIPPPGFASSSSSSSSSSRYTCAWFDHSTSKWSSSGCSTTRDRLDRSRINCSCSHLTDFAILLMSDLLANETGSDVTTATASSPSSSSSYAPLDDDTVALIYLVFIPLYCILCLITLRFSWIVFKSQRKLIHKPQQIDMQSTKRLNNFGIFGTLLVLICIARIVSLFAFSQQSTLFNFIPSMICCSDKTNPHLIVVLAILAVIPPVLQFWIYSFLIVLLNQTVLAIKTLSAVHKRISPQMRCCILIGNTIVGLSVVGAVVSTATRHRPLLMIEIASSVFGVICIIFGVNFPILGRQLRELVMSISDESSMAKFEVLTTLMVRGTNVLGIVKLIQASLWIFSAVDPIMYRRGVFITTAVIAFLTGDVLSMCVFVAYQEMVARKIVDVNTGRSQQHSRRDALAIRMNQLPHHNNVAADAAHAEKFHQAVHDAAHHHLPMSKLFAMLSGDTALRTTAHYQEDDRAEALTTIATTTVAAAATHV